MDRRSFARSGFRHYARTNKAVIAGVAIAVAVLMGAMITGDSVRVSLRQLALSRLGKTSQVLTSAQFFREVWTALDPRPDLVPQPVHRLGVFRLSPAWAVVTAATLVICLCLIGEARRFVYVQF